MVSIRSQLGAGLARLMRGVARAEDGAGPLLQRDYWAKIRNSRLGPRAIMAEVSARFEHFPPEELVCFERRCPQEGPLAIGAELEIRIRMAGECAVRVVHADPNCLTLATLEGHPEAGRITFGSYRDERGGVLFHIRSRARAASRSRYLGFLAMGDAMQTNTWVDFINAVAAFAGEGVDGEIQVTTRKLDDEPPEAAVTPTFLAQGD